MNISEYITWILSAESDAAILCLVLTAGLLLSVVGAIFTGIRRGALRQLVRTALSAAGLYLSYIFTTKTIAEFTVLSDGKTTVEMLEEMQLSTYVSENVYNIFSNLDPEIAEELLLLPVTTLIAPILFVVYYALISIVAAIIFFILKKTVIPRFKNFTSSVLGAIIGAAEAVVITSLMLLPFVAIVDVTGAAVERIDTTTNGSGDIVTVYEEDIKPLGECPIFTLTRALGGQQMLDEFARGEVDGEEVDMREQIGVAIEILNGYVKLNGADLTKLTDDDKAAITSMIDAATESPYYATLISGVLKMTALSVEDGYIDLGSEPPFDILVSDMIAIFETSDKDNLLADLTTVKNVYFILSDADLLASADSSDGARDAFTKKDADGNTVVNLVIGELDKNERTRPLITTITKLSVAILADSLGEDVTETYESVKTGINETLSIKRENFASDEEHEAAVSESINNTLVENGITLEPEIVDTITDYYFEYEFDQMEELTDEDVNDLILSYYDAYLEYVEGAN